MDFTCIACMEDQHDHPIDVLNNTICRACFDRGIRPLFEAAVRDESQYPPTFGGQPLNIAPYAEVGLIAPEIHQQYLKKEKEYAILTKDRVYCTCGRFLGPKAIHSPQAQCECGRQTCPERYGTIDGTLSHVCDRTLEAHDYLKGLVRGRDYQICTCGCVVELSDGCNHIVCKIPACRRHFCYICGEDATEGLNHWAVGSKCPKYNQPGAANAQYQPLRDQAEIDAMQEQRQFREKIHAIAAQLNGPAPVEIPGDADNQMLRIAHASLENQLRQADVQELHRLNQQARQLLGAPREGPAPAWLVEVVILTNALPLFSHELLRYVAHLLGDVGRRFMQDIQFRDSEQFINDSIFRTNRALDAVIENAGLGLTENAYFARLAPIVNLYRNLRNGHFDALRTAAGAGNPVANA